MKERIGIVEELGTTASVYSSISARRPIFAGVRKRVIVVSLSSLRYSLGTGTASPSPVSIVCLRRSAGDAGDPKFENNGLNFGTRSKVQRARLPRDQWGFKDTPQ